MDSKAYRSTFLWGQCTAWFKQTVFDPTASLSADRRGVLSLPDCETAYSAVSRLHSLPNKSRHMSQLQVGSFAGIKLVRGQAKAVAPESAEKGPKYHVANLAAIFFPE